MNVESIIGHCHINALKWQHLGVLMVIGNKGATLQTIFFQVASNILANESEQTQNTQMFMF